MSRAFSRVHVIGAGLAGLSAAMELAEGGMRVVVHEAGPQAGGRCRSYFDRELDCRIDNGNHLLLSGNAAAERYLGRISARQTMVGPKTPIFPFIDRADGSRWTLRLDAGRIPFWIFDARRRVVSPDWCMWKPWHGRRLPALAGAGAGRGVLGATGAS